jgi:NAD(P)-dependent dehydrogenase (short-subunit alcohol dehydrogenase family)
MKPALVVLDAGQSLGEAVVRAALARSWPVIAVADEPAALAGLRRRHPVAELVTLQGGIDDDAEAAALAGELRALDRPLSGVVVARCPENAGGRVLDQPSLSLRCCLDDGVLPQLSAARALLPLLAERGRDATYVAIGGPGGEHPWAGYGQRSIAAAAQRMLLRVLHDEARTLAVRVQLLAVDKPMRTDDNAAQACPGWPGLDAIAARAIGLIARDDPARSTEAVVRMTLPHAPAPKPVLPAPDGPQRLLDDTWARLQPYFLANSRETDTP